MSGDCVGQYTDPTSLIYLRARMYDPATGQFLTIDPLVDATRQPYSYVAGNPLNATDPSGLHGPAINPFGGNFWTKGNIFSDPVQKNLACGNSVYTSLVMAYDPVYGGLQGYSNARDNGNSIYASLVMSADPAYGAIAHGTAAVDDFNQGRYAAAAGEASQSALDTAATVAVATGIGTGWGAVAEESGVASSYIDLTRGGSIRNIGTDVTNTEFADTLASNGWASSVSKDGAVQIFQKDGAKYVLRQNAGSYSGWTADFTPAGSTDITLKIRLGYSP